MTVTGHSILPGFSYSYFYFQMANFMFKIICLNLLTIMSKRAEDIQNYKYINY